MPVITEGKAPASARWKHRGRGLWLLAPPALALFVLVASAFRPLQLGPFVIIAVSFTSSSGGWQVWVDPNPYPVPGPGLVGGKYQVDAPGTTAGLDLGMWHYSVICFRGHRAR